MSRSSTQVPRTGYIFKHDIHHIDGDRDNNAIENLMILCRGCHKRMHRVIRLFLIR